MTIPPSEISLIRSRAANIRWAFEDDRSGATAAARAAFIDRFERYVDPTRSLPSEERLKRAANLRKAYYRDLALKSARARRARAAGAK